jgi:hypothetical protein
MRHRTRARKAVRRLVCHVRQGLIFVGSYAWAFPEMYAVMGATVAEAHRRGEPAPPGDLDQVTPYADLSYRERRLFLRLEEQIRQENGR